MYQSSDLVLYGIHGVCKITAIETKTVNKKQIRYYVLQPVNQNSTTFFVPADNEAALSKMRPIMTKNEIDDLLSANCDVSDLWIADENKRKQLYRELIVSGDRVALLQMIRVLDLHKKEQQTAGRKFHQCDENFMRDAIKLLDEELSVVLNMDPCDVRQYVAEKMSSK